MTCPAAPSGRGSRRARRGRSDAGGRARRDAGAEEHAVREHQGLERHGPAPRPPCAPPERPHGGPHQRRRGPRPPEHQPGAPVVHPPLVVARRADHRGQEHAPPVLHGRGHPAPPLPERPHRRRRRRARRLTPPAASLDGRKRQ